MRRTRTGYWTVGGAGYEKGPHDVHVCLMPPVPSGGVRSTEAMRRPWPHWPAPPVSGIVLWIASCFGAGASDG
jgi:hypothetical protein